MTRAALLDVFSQGARIPALANLLGEQPDSIEAGIRLALNERLQDRTEEQQHSPAEGAAPSRHRVKRAAVSSARPANHATALKRSPARRAVARIMDSPASDLSRYPEEIRDPRAASLRAAYDALKGGPLVLGAVATAIGATSAAAIAALGALREKCLAAKEDGHGGAWRLTELSA